MMLDAMMKVLEDRVASCDNDPLYCHTCGAQRHTPEVMCIKDSCEIVCRECSGSLCTIEKKDGQYTLKEVRQAQRMI